MAITSSIGYGGPVYDTEVPTWARALGGVDYCVYGASHWKVTAVGAAARTVQIAAGAGSGRGIYDVSSGGDTVVLPNPSSGSLWHLIVARRNVSTGTTTFTYCTGASTQAAAVANRKTFESTSGVEDDQPLALVRVTKDVSTIQGAPLDMRCWQANGGLVAGSDEARLYLDRPGTHLVMPSGLEWTRIVGADGNAAWIARQPEPTVRRWMSVISSTRGWPKGTQGTMNALTVTGGPAGEYIAFANATVRRQGTVEIPSAMSKQFYIGSEATIAVQDDIVGNVWVDRSLILPVHRASAGNFAVSYRINAGQYDMSVKFCRLTVVYIGPGVQTS